jgi:4'-phosphopantetheinyl transferase
MPGSSPQAEPGRGEVVVVVAHRPDLLAAAPPLSPDERLRAEAIAHPGARARFVAGRALLRRTLSRIAGVVPDTIDIGAAAGQAPVLGGALAHLRVSLSHGETHEALAVATAPVGIDVEETCPDDFEALAAVIMDPAELNAFHLLPAPERRAAFLRLWTRKEALLKAAGLGFSIDPRSAAVGLGLPPGQGRLDAHGPTFALADLPVGPGAVALAGQTVTVRMLDA